MSVELTLQDLVAGYGATVVVDGISLALPPGGTLAVLGRNGVGKTTLLATLMGLTTLHRGAVLLASERIDGLPTHQRARLGLGLRAAGARDLSLAHHRGKSGRLRASRRLEHRGSARLVSSPQGTPPHHRQSAIRRRAADAGDRPRAGRRTESAPARRAAGGARTDRDRDLVRRPDENPRRKRIEHHPGGAERRASHSRSRRTWRCSTVARSCISAAARRCAPTRRRRHGCSEYRGEGCRRYGRAGG